MSWWRSLVSISRLPQWFFFVSDPWQQTNLSCISFLLTSGYRSKSFRRPHISLNASYASSIIGRSAAAQVPSRNKGRGGVCAPGRKDRKAPRRGRMQYAARYDAAFESPILSSVLSSTQTPTNF